MADEKADLQSFLNKVDDIESLIKGLSASEYGAEDKADQYLEKIKPQHKKITDNTGVNRTVINQEAFSDGSQPGPAVGADMDQRGFMAMMEQDAKERRERRKVNEREATDLKEKGNEYFKEGRFSEALDLYTQAINKVRDWTILYTNRAQTYIKLEQYDKALEDCDWALRVFENCLKAYIHQGRAYIGLQEFDKAITSFEKAISIEPSKKHAIQGYIKEAEHKKKTLLEERSAEELFESGQENSKNLVELLERIKKPDQIPLFYSGGLRLIEQLLISNENDRVLFRSHGGVILPRTHPVISKCFNASPRMLSEPEIDLCTMFYNVLIAACSDNVENQRLIFDSREFIMQTMRFLESKNKLVLQVKKSILTLLNTVSQTEMGRAKFMSTWDINKLLSVLLQLSQKTDCALLCSTLLNNIAIDNKFRSLILENIEDDLLPALENSMMDSSCSKSLLPTAITTVTNLCGDSRIRAKMVKRKQTWAACDSVLSMYSAQDLTEVSRKILYATMGLLINLSYNGSCEQLQTSASRLSSSCCHILLTHTAGDLELAERCLVTLSHVLPQSSKAAEKVHEMGLTTKLLEILKERNDVTGLAMKCLSSVTQYSSDARTTVVDFPKGVKAVLSLLQHADDKVIGNAALCLGHCAADQRVCKVLTRTDIIKELLVHARDQHRHEVQHNCAILIAKLCKGHAKHLERLRELNGIEILHDVVKHGK